MIRLLALLSLPLFACHVGGTPVEALRYACTSDQDCAEGWRCDEVECVRTEEPVAARDAGHRTPTCAASEVCDNGVDDDCDGVADCQESQCADAACGPQGQRCSAGFCVCAPKGAQAEAAEVTCGDGADNDCDGLVDCADDDCAQQTCGESVLSICCGSTCAVLSEDEANCGGCGISCRGGRQCNPVEVNGTAVSGRCECSASVHCPGGGAGLAEGQSCAMGSCVCTSDGACGAGQQCTLDGGSAGWCSYPQ